MMEVGGGDDPINQYLSSSTGDVAAVLAVVIGFPS
jgi:hypothetical protein